MKLPFDEKATGLLMGSIGEFNPVQTAALRAGLLDGKSLVVAAPTASGKTLVAEMALLRNFYNGGKTIYLCPLRALAQEKHEDFQKYKQIGMRIAIATGDLDSTDRRLDAADLIILSNEKADSLLRHNSLPKPSLIIADEIHLINDVSRGPTLEVVITRLKDAKQILALSATITNAEELAEWLEADIVKSDYRPIKLEKGVFYPDGKNHILEIEDNIYEFDGFGDSELVLHNNFVKDKQSLVFVSTRRGAEAAAEKLGNNFTNPELIRIAKEIENALPVPTKQCKRLADCVRQGTAFHHAGLVAKQRKLVEDSFRNGKIKVLTATTTLASGVNLPAHTVVIRDTKRYDSEYGSGYMPIIEIQQCMGRAGRPKYDREGRAVIIGKNKKEAQELREMYINGEPEPIYSKMSVEPVLRMHTLALIASDVGSKNQLRDFFSKTFFAYQYKKMKDVMNKVEMILKELEAFKFIKIGDEKFISEDFVPAFAVDKDVPLKATLLGKRVSELYIDPLSAAFIIDNINVKSVIEQLMVISRCGLQKMNVKKNEADEIEDRLAKSGIAAPDVWDVDYYDFLRAFKAACVFEDWIEERTEDYMLDKHGVAPGELYTRTKNAEWLLYAARELSLILRKKEEANLWNKLCLRMEHGVREELLKLIVLKGIGRARARKLYNAGIKTFAEIKGAGEQNVGKIVGPKVAKQILEEANKERVVKYGAHS